MDSCEGGGGGGRGEGEERTTASPSLSPVVSLDVGWSSRTSASAPAKEPLTQPEPEPEQGGAEGSEAREDTQGGELTEGGGHKRGDGQSPEEEEEEEKETDKEEVFADEGEEAVCIGPHSRRDGGEDQEEEEEEAISNQSQTKSKCSLLPQQSQHSSSSSTVMANGTHYRKIPTSPKPRPSLSLSPELSLSPATSPKLSLSPTTSPKLSLSPATSPKLSSSPSTSPKHFTHTSSSPSPLSQAEFRDTPRGDQGCTPGFPQSFKSQQSALAFPLTAPESTSMYAEEGGAAGVTQTSIANGDVAKAPEPNDSQGESEVDEERSKERDDAVLQNLQQDLSPNSLSSHMTLMHSRNSCKTLKCPKCNWHYKSQHTLQAHMKEKHPETEGQCVCDGSEGKCVCGGNRDVCLFCSSGQSHPRLARGETYACGYKPFRCEVCDYATSSKGNLSIHMQSDKHLNNVQAGGHANGHSLAQAEQTTHNCGPSNGYTTEDQAFKQTHHVVTPPAKHTTPSPTNSVGKRWRCDVCDYETSIARNLRIHTTSEKHTHNMMRLQRGYYLSHCRSLTPQLTQLKHLNGTGGELSLTMRLSSQQVPELPAPLGSALTPSPSPSPSPPPPPPPPLSPTPSLSQAALQCLVCVSFSSDCMEVLEQHLSAPRSLPQSEWCSLVAGGCHCRLCGYTTPLRANFSLHCQTDRHRSRYQLAAHIREGGATGQEEANLVAKGNPVQLRCNLCDHVTNSVEKLRAHCLGSHHEARQRVYKFLQKFDSAVEEGSWLLHCLPCNFSSPSKLHLTRHAHSAAHQQKEGLLGRPSPTEGGLMGGEELAAIFTIRKCSTPDAGDLNDLEDSSEDSNYLSDKTKDTVTWRERWAAKETDDTSGEDGERRDSVPPVKRRSPGSDEIESPFLPKRPRTHQHTAHQQLAQCPLCQVKLAHAQLRHHLTHLHSVAQDCVDKLISTVLPLPEQFEGLVLPEQEPQQQNPENASNTKDSSLQKNGTLMEDLDSTTPKHVSSLLTPPLEEQLSAEPDTPNGHAQSLSPLLPHSPPSPPGDLALSDRHGYKFRCSKCSLAFPTREKLQVHWQYHAMRAATECSLCSRQCRSQEALQRHLNNTHSPQETALWQNALLERGQADQEKSTGSLQPPATAQDEGEDEALEDGGECMSRESTVEPIREGVGEDTMEDEVEKEDRPLELAGKSGLGASEPGSVAPQQEESGLEPSHILPPRRSSSSTIERYMDPSRPYKCSVCSESFTQKTILLVHYNSVSHLHRARRAQQDSAVPQQADAPRGSDPRPYRCKVCGVGYSQSSTLDIHLRSVLHQSRARAAQTQASQPPAQTPAPPLVPAATSSPLSRGGEESSRGLGPASPSLSSLAGPSSRVDSHKRLSGQAEGLQAKRRVADLLATRSQQTLMLLQQQQQLAQAQAQLQQHTNLLQSQIFNPALLKHFSLGQEALMKQHFSITPDSLLSLQQQLLLPFYLSGELNLSPDFTAKGPETGKTASTSSPEKEQPRGEAKRDDPAPNPTEPPQELPCEAAADSSFSMDQSHGAPNPGEEGGEGGKDLLPVKTEKDPEEAEASVSHLGSSVSHGDSCPPPRVPYAAVSGGAFRALLGSFGYELALQYTQGTQRHQQKSPAQPQAGGQEDSDNVQLEQQSEVDMKISQMENGETERCPEGNKEAANGEVKGRLEERECGECGKLFSDFLVLKSHQEYVHKLLLPPTMLESFSRQYRMTYDRLYPLTHTVSVEKTAPAASPTPDPETATSPPKLQSHPAPASTPSPAKALTPAPAPATPSPPPSPSQPECFPQQEAAVPSVPSPDPSPPAPQPNSSIPLPLLPLPSLSLPSIPLSVPPMPFHIDLPLLSPAMMQSMALQSQAMLSTMDPGLNSDLTKFYQSQLSPVLLGQQSQLSPALLGQQPQLSPALLGQQPQLSPGLSGPSKRARTRISEEQLNVLKQHFSISSLPSDEQINKMAALSALPHKVIKHWFRNTLFKERQRDKDSPYNFSNPPTTPLEKTGEEPPALSQSDPPETQSPAPPAQHPPQPQRQETHRGEHHRSRRSSRTRFTEQQLETLQGVFEASPYPREEEYDRLSALLSLPNRVIVVWFQNARQRARKTQEKGSDGGREERPDEGANRKRGDGTQSQRGRRRKRDHSDDEDDDEGQCDSQNENSMDLAYEYYTHSDSPSNTPVPSDPQATPHHADKESTRSESSHPRDVDFKTPSTCAKTREVEGEAPDSEIQSQTRETPLDKHPKTPVLSSDFSPQKPSPTSHFGSQSSPIAPQRSTPAPAPVSPNSPPPPAPAKFLPPPGSPADSHQPQTKAHPQTKAQAHPQFQCSLCPISLPSFQLWQEHQTRHLLAAQSQVQLLHPGFTDRPPLPYMLLHPSQNFLTSQLLSGAMSQMHPSHTHPMMSHMSNAHANLAHNSHALATLPHPSLPSPKQGSKVSPEVRQGCEAGSREREDDQRRDKRQRTTITPEQLEVLYQRYSLDSNPTRGVLEGIARDVGLGRRVVQVWFQNTRARERKGQFRSLGAGGGLSLSHNHLRCPFCRALFKVRSALDAHVRSRHGAEAERVGYSLPVGAAPVGNFGDLSSYAYRERQCSSMSPFLPSSSGAIATSRDQESGNAGLTSDSLAFDLNNQEGEEEDEEEAEEGVEEEYGCEEGSSLVDPASPSPEASGAASSIWGDKPVQRHHQQQQQRQRTHMSHLQVLQLRAFYRNHRTPSRLECEALGQDLGLARRVVQVWFQNARAKEKRARSLSNEAATGERDQMELTARAGERDRA